MTIEGKLHLNRVGGSSLVNFPPLFSHDGKLLFCTCGPTVKILSTITGKCVQRLISGKGDITGISLHPRNKLQVITSTCDGELTVWDYEDGISLQSVNVGLSISKIACHPNISDFIFFCTGRETYGMLQKVPIDIFSGPITDAQVIASKVFIKLPRPVCFLKSGERIVYIRKGDMLCVMDVKRSVESALYVGRRDDKISCFACNPVEDYIATGYLSGIINFWHNLCNRAATKNRSAIMSWNHWHSQRVCDMAFTPGGSSMLSVGMEGVLVEWRYKQGDNRNFLPRLGTSCRHVVISNDSSLYAVTHVDNSVSVVTNQFLVKHSIHGLSGVGISEHQSNLTFYYDHRTKSCITTGKTGHLMFYDPSTDQELYSVDVTHENYLGPLLSKQKLYSEITRVATEVNENSDASWMATVEVARMEKLHNAPRMKLWLLDKDDKWWKLNTVINDVHKSDVTRLCFRPAHSDSDQSYLVSTGADGLVKLWGMVTKDKSSYWSCTATASYRKLPAAHCDFSQDGSVLAVAFRHTVCLLDPLTLNITRVLLSNDSGNPVEKLVFGKYSCQHMIMIVSEKSMQAFDLLSGSVSWVVDLHIPHIAVDYLSEFMFAVSDDNDLYVVKPTCAEPLYTHRQLAKRKVLSVFAVPYSDTDKWLKDDCSDIPWLARSKLYITDSSLSVFTLSVSDNMRNILPSIGGSQESRFMNPMAHILEKSANVNTDCSGLSELEVAAHGADVSSSVKAITDSPAHILPSVTEYCAKFLTSFLSNLKVQEAPVSCSNAPVVEMQAAASDSSKLSSNSDCLILESITAVSPQVGQMEFLHGL